MKLEKNLLIVDDRPILIQSLKFVLKTRIGKKMKMNVHVATTYQGAIETLKYFSDKGMNVDFILLNIDIQSNQNHGLILTKNYIKKIKRFNPNIKIIIFSNGSGNYRVNYIIRECKPDGFMMENDIKLKEIIKIFDITLKSEIYYSKTIHAIINKFKHKYIPVDEIDFHILHFLKLGIKTNFLQNYIPLTNSAIEKRKYKLKELFLFEKCSDHQLINEAVKKGIL